MILETMRVKMSTRMMLNRSQATLIVEVAHIEVVDVDIEVVDVDSSQLHTLHLHLFLELNEHKELILAHHWPEQALDVGHVEASVIGLAIARSLFILIV